MSQSIVVVEASLRSGSLITARLSLEQGKDVFALPGSIQNPLSKGCHKLIQNGAKLIQSAEDVICEMAGHSFTPRLKKSVKTTKNHAKLDQECKNLLNYVGFEPTTLEQIILRSGISPSKVTTLLLELEMQDYVKMSSGGYVKILN